MKLLLLIILGYLAAVQSGSINRYLRKPIEPSVNNAGELADYTFRFTIDTDLFASN